MSSIYTRIINGELPCHKIYEDEHSIAFLDINPLREGHTLVVSKKEIATYDQLSEDDFAALMRTVHKVAKKQREVFPEAKRIIELSHSYGVEHTHVHVYPTNSYEEFKDSVIAHEGDIPESEPDHEALAEVAAKLKV